MKRKLLAMLLCWVFLITGAAAVTAEDPQVLDFAGVLSDEETVTLELKARSLTEKYDMGVVLLILDSLGDVDPTRYADDFYDSHSYGVDDMNSGLLLLIDLPTRQWALSTTGNAIDALTEHGQEDLMAYALPYWGEDDWYGGFESFLGMLPLYLDAYQNGDPVDIVYGEEEESGLSWITVAVAVVVGLLVGGVTIGVMKSQMNTTDDQRSASDYLREDTYDLSAKTDTFLYTNVTKTKKPKDNDSSSTHTGSSGTSHGGSSGTF